MARTSVFVPVPEELKARPLTLYGIEGHLLRRNDAVFQPALPRSASPRALANQQTLVYFGGDIQNLSHLMDQTDDSIIDHQTWCLEETALRLSSDFPSCHIVVIKPSRVMFDHISCFDNFVESNIVGIPKHYYHYVALMHLEKLLKAISKALQEMDPDDLFKMLLRTIREERFQEINKIETTTSCRYANMSAGRKRLLLDWQKNLRLHEYPLTLVAFSKGCVVLNQFLYEFHYAKGLEPKHVESSFIDRIRDIYWLDSGNCGRNVYISSMGLLKTLAALDLIVHVHVSMYMTEDENRPWIGEQFNEFINGIIASNGNVIHFRHVTSTEDLESHFKVLVLFKFAERRHMRSINSPRVRRKRTLSPVLEPASSEAPVRVRARPRIQSEKGETIAYCLVNPYVTPYLGLQMLKQKPGFTPEATHARISCPQYRNCVQILPSNYVWTPSSSQMPSAPVEPSMPAQTPSTPVHTMSAQMPSNSAEPSTSVQTPSTTGQKPSSPNMLVWSSDLLPKNYKLDTPVLWNELVYSLSEEEVAKYKDTAYCELMAPVVVIPSQLNPLNLHVFSPVKNIYVPSLSNHHFVVDRKNKKQEGEDLPDFFDEEPPASDALDSRRTASSSNSTASRSARNATGAVSFTPAPGADVSSPDSHNSDSASNALVSDSISGSADVSNPDSADEYSPDSADDDSNSDTADEVSNSDLADEVSNFDLADEVSNPDSADDVSNSDSSDEVSNFDLADEVSNPDSADDVSNSDSSDEVSNPDLADEVSNFDLADEVSNPDSADDVSNPDSHIVDGPSASDSDFSLRFGSHVDSRSGSRSALGPSLSTLVATVRFVTQEQIFFQAILGSRLGSVTQLEPNTVADRPVISQRATRRSAHIAQPDVSQNQVDTPRDLNYSQSTSPGFQVASSSQDSVASRAGTSGARVRARDVDDEPPCRYNLRKRIKRSYDETNLRIQYQ